MQCRSRKKKGINGTPIDKFEGGGWILVRQIKQGKSWHYTEDNLEGNHDAYVKDAGLSFNHIFVHESFDQFLFVSGDRKKWLMADKSEISGEYTGQRRTILKSSKSEDPHESVMYNRSARAEDPWIGITDHMVADSNRDMVYGEGCNPAHHSLLENHGGCQVFIRNSDLYQIKSDPSPAMTD